MTPTIKAAGLRKRFGKTVALDGLDLVAEPGQVLAVLGPNGAGKTTFVRAVATLLRPDGGELRVAGHDVRREAGAVRRVIGLAGQYAAVEPAMTGRENLYLVARLFGQDARAARASSARVLELLGLSGAADRLARTYSGGMRRKLDLGASLVGSPRLLLLDEPTTGLDPRSRIELWDAIRGLVAAGTPSELKQRAGRNVIEVHVRDQTDLPRVADALAALDHGEAQVEEATRRVSVAVEAGTDRLRQALGSLDAAGASVDDIALRPPTLDEVFLALTGQALEQAPDNAAGHPAA